MVLRTSILFCFFCAYNPSHSCMFVCAWINVARSNETFQRKGDELTHSLIHGRNCSHHLFIAFCCCMHAVGVYVRGNSSGACCCNPWSRHTLFHFLAVGMQQQQVKPGTALQQSLDSWESQAAKAVEVKKTTRAPDAVKEEPKEGVKGCKGKWPEAPSEGTACPWGLFQSYLVAFSVVGFNVVGGFPHARRSRDA